MFSCRYFDAFIENDKLFIVTELARGGDIGAKVSVFLPSSLLSDAPAFPRRTLALMHTIMHAPV